MNQFRNLRHFLSTTILDLRLDFTSYKFRSKYISSEFLDTNTQLKFDAIKFILSENLADHDAIDEILLEYIHNEYKETLGAVEGCNTVADLLIAKYRTVD